MKRILCLLLTLCLTAACSLAGAEEAASLGKPYANPNLMTAFTERPGPEENYYLYVNFDGFVQATNGGHKHLASQEGRVYRTLSDNLTEIGLNTEYTDPESQIVRILYGLITDHEKREQDGLAPLLFRIERLRAVKSTEELTALLQEENFLLSIPFLYCGFTKSALDPEQFIVQVSRGPMIELIMPPENATPEEMAEMKKDFETSRRKLLIMQYSEEEADRLVQEIARYDDDFATDWPDWLTPENKPVSLETVRENSPLLYALLNAGGMVKEGAETQPVYEISPGDFSTFLAWYTDENLETLKAMVALSLYNDSRRCLNQEMFKESGDFGSLKGEENMVFDTLRTIAQLPMEQAYVTHYCPAEIWQTATDVFEELREAMRARIKASDWLLAETKERAMAKLDDLMLGQIVPKGGNFDCEPLLEKLRGCDTLMDAAAYTLRFDRQCMRRYAGEAIDRDNPYTLGSGNTVLPYGGHYEPEQNMFVLGAPAVGEAWADYTSRATLLGSLGWHISHELSHGYDFIGAQRDATGTRSLFSEEDSAIFKEKVMSVAAVLDRIENGNGVKVKGETVITEAMADMTGITLLLDLAKQEENFDYDAFFRTCAKSNFAYEPGDDGNTMNPHPLYHVRVNFTLAHFDEFYRTYPSVTEGTPMYLAPEDRILVW